MNLVERISEIFEETPYNIEEIRKLLLLRQFTEDELAQLAIDFTDYCFCEYYDALNPECESVTIDNMHSNHIVAAIRLLLEFGLNPNTIVNDENVMWNTMFIDTPNVAASVMKVLLESGGNPNHFIPAEGESLFDCISFKVSYNEYTHKYFYTVQCWLLLMAYGACWQNGKIPLKMLGEKTVDIFKDFELYDYEIEPLPQIPNRYGCWIMHIYSIETREEVAIYG